MEPQKTTKIWEPVCAHEGPEAHGLQSGRLWSHVFSMGSGTRRTPKSNQEGSREIRKVMNEVISSWLWESLRGCKFRNLPLLCKEQVQSLVQRKFCSRCNSTALLMGRWAHNYSARIRPPANSKCAKSSDIKGARTRGVSKEVARQSPGTIMKKQDRDSMSPWSGYNDTIPYSAKMTENEEERMERESDGRKI